MVNIKETLMSGGAFRFLIDANTGEITDTQAQTRPNRRRVRRTPCGRNPDGSKDNYDCLQTGFAVGKQEGLKVGRKEGRKRQEKFGKKQQALLGAMSKDEGEVKFRLGKDLGEVRGEQKAEKQLKKQKEFSKKQQALASALTSDKAKQKEREKSKAEFAKSGKRIGEMFKKGKEIGIKKQKEFAEKQQVLATELGRIQGKKQAQSQTPVVKAGPSKEFQAKQQKLSSEMGKIEGKLGEMARGRIPIGQASANQAKGLLNKLGATNYQNPSKDDAIARLRRDYGVNYFKFEGQTGQLTPYRALRGRGCKCK